MKTGAPLASYINYACSYHNIKSSPAFIILPPGNLFITGFAIFDITLKGDLITFHALLIKLLNLLFFFLGGGVPAGPLAVIVYGYVYYYYYKLS